MTRLAPGSSMGVPMKMMRSFSRREKMSYARSPRLVCSTTMGMRYMLPPLSCRRNPGWQLRHHVLPTAAGGEHGRPISCRYDEIVGIGDSGLLEQKIQRLAFQQPGLESGAPSRVLHGSPHGGSTLTRVRRRHLLDVGVHLYLAHRQVLL